MYAPQTPSNIDHAKLFAPEGLDEHQVLSGQKTQKAAAYQRLLRNFKARMGKDREFRERMNVEFLEQLEQGQRLLAMYQRGAQPGTFHQNRYLDNFSVQYSNDSYIAERLMPVVPVTQRSNIYAKFDRRSSLAYPNDEIGPDARAPEISSTRSNDNYSVKDYGLVESVLQETLDNQDSVFDEMADAVDHINDGVAHNREIRVAAMVRDVNNYGGNVQVLSGATQFDSGSANLIATIQDAGLNTWEGPGSGKNKRIMVSGLEVYNVFSRDPAIRDLYKYTGNGLAMPAAIAGFFGFDEYLIGRSRHDDANIGQAESVSRIWGKDIAVLSVMQSPSRRTATWGAIFRMKNDPLVLSWFDPSRGRGAYFSKVCVSEDYKIIAPDTSFLLKNAVA